MFRQPRRRRRRKRKRGRRRFRQSNFFFQAPPPLFFVLATFWPPPPPPPMPPPTLASSGICFPGKTVRKRRDAWRKKGGEILSGQQTAENFFEYIKNTASHHQQSFPPFFKPFQVSFFGLFLSLFFFLSLIGHVSF